MNGARLDHRNNGGDRFGNQFTRSSREFRSHEPDGSGFPNIGGASNFTRDSAAYYAQGHGNFTPSHPTYSNWNRGWGGGWNNGGWRGDHGSHGAGYWLTGGPLTHNAFAPHISIGGPGYGYGGYGGYGYHNYGGYGYGRYGCGPSFNFTFANDEARGIYHNRQARDNGPQVDDRFYAKEMAAYVRQYGNAPESSPEYKLAQLCYECPQIKDPKRYDQAAHLIRAVFHSDSGHLFGRGAISPEGRDALVRALSSTNLEPGAMTAFDKTWKKGGDVEQNLQDFAARNGHGTPSKPMTPEEARNAAIAKNGSATEQKTVASTSPASKSTPSSTTTESTTPAASTTASTRTFTPAGADAGTETADVSKTAGTAKVIIANEAVKTETVKAGDKEWHVISNSDRPEQKVAILREIGEKTETLRISATGDVNKTFAVESVEGKPSPITSLVKAASAIPATGKEDVAVAQKALNDTIKAEVAAGNLKFPSDADKANFTATLLQNKDPVAVTKPNQPSLDQALTAPLPQMAMERLAASFRGVS